MVDSLYKRLIEISETDSIVDSGESESNYIKPGVKRRLDRIHEEQNSDFVQKSVNLHEQSLNTIKEHLLLERMDFLEIAKGIVKSYNLKSTVIFKPSKMKHKADYVVETDTITLEPTSNFKDFLMTVLHEIHHALQAKKFGKKKFIKKYNQSGVMAAHYGLDPHDDNKWEEKAEQFARNNVDKLYKKLKKA